LPVRRAVRRRSTFCAVLLVGCRPAGRRAVAAPRSAWRACSGRGRGNNATKVRKVAHSPQANRTGRAGGRGGDLARVRASPCANCGLPAFSGATRAGPHARIFRRGPRPGRRAAAFPCQRPPKSSPNPPVFRIPSEDPSSLRTDGVGEGSALSRFPRGSPRGAGNRRPESWRPCRPWSSSRDAGWGAARRPPG
jgi:hypothetical protein